jgi:hypothetical protein
MTPPRPPFQKVPAVLMLVQVAMLPDGHVEINTPPGLELTTCDRVGLAHLTLAKGLAKLEAATFVPPPDADAVEMAPPGTRVARNPLA